MMSQNGWPVLPTNRTSGALPRLRKWTVPGTGRHLYLRDGSAGFLLVFIALWWHERIERLDVGVWDEWGWNYRPVRGSSSVMSNHSSGTAIDLNATRHPLGRRFTMSNAVHYVRIRALLAGRLRGAIRWGGDYQNRADEMHFELVKGLSDCEALARKLAATPRGRRILAANPGAGEVIHS